MRDGTSTRWATALSIGLGLYMAGLYWLRPASPFEWDEVLFQRALVPDSTSPGILPIPGYPVYVAMGRLLRLAVGEPMLALQLASIVGAALAALALWHLARRVGASRPSAIASVGLLLATPAFAFHANVGLSDVTASATGLLTVLSLVWALEEPAWLPLAALSIGLSTGVRPQLLALAAPLGLVVAFRATRERGLRALAAGALCGLAGLVVVWVPAVLATGPRFFLDAFTAQMTGVIVEESGLRLPAAPFGLIAASWLVDPFGAPWLAVAFWLLVCLGTCSWLRSGKRTLVAVAAGAGGSYLLAAMFLLNRTTSARYVLPAMPFLALLAAGAVGWPRRGLRFLSQAAVLVWMGFAVRWLLPVCLIRTESAPLWASLAFVEQNFEPGRTTVLFDPAFLPHVEYVLGARGFNATALPAVDDARGITGAAGRRRAHAHSALRPPGSLPLRPLLEARPTGPHDRRSLRSLSGEPPTSPGGAAGPSPLVGGTAGRPEPALPAAAAVDRSRRGAPCGAGRRGIRREACRADRRRPGSGRRAGRPLGRGQLRRRCRRLRVRRPARGRRRGAEPQHRARVVSCRADAHRVPGAFGRRPPQGTQALSGAESTWRADAPEERPHLARGVDAVAGGPGQPLRQRPAAGPGMASALDV